MNVSRRWLEDFLRRPLEVRDLTERLTMLGAPVDAVEPLHADLAEDAFHKRGTIDSVVHVGAAPLIGRPEEIQ